MLLLLGYPRILSGDIIDTDELVNVQNHLFPREPLVDEPWLINDNQFRRHLLSFPMFPFRTLHPRNAHSYFPTEANTFDGTSPIFPANTQINIVFKRRPRSSLINFLLPTNLNYNLGSSAPRLTAEERLNALSYAVMTPMDDNADGEAQDPEQIDWVITNVEFNMKDMYLQECIISLFIYNQR